MNIYHPICSQSDRDAWLAARHRFITASDAPRLLGVLPYDRRPVEEIIRGKAIGETVEDSAAMEAGRRLETVVMQWGAEVISERVGTPIVFWSWGELVASVADPWLAATPDGWAIDDEGGGIVEVKCHSQHTVKDWREGPPEYVLRQVDVQLYVTGAPRCYVVRWAWGTYPDVYAIEAADRADEIRATVEALRGVWDTVCVIREMER